MSLTIERLARTEDSPALLVWLAFRTRSPSGSELRSRVTVHTPEAQGGEAFSAPLIVTFVSPSVQVPWMTNAPWLELFTVDSISSPEIATTGALIEMGSGEALAVPGGRLSLSWQPDAARAREVPAANAIHEAIAGG